MSKSTPSEMVKHITSHEVFKNLPPNANLQLEKIVHCIDVKKNETLFCVGQEPNFIYYIVSGAMTLQFPDNTDLDIGKGELIGEIGVLNGNFRLGTLTVTEDSQIIGISAAKLFDPNYIGINISLQIVRTLAKRVTNYLRSIQQTSTLELISKGESDRVEFKSTLRWNIRAQKKDKNITHAILKTIAAFLNTEGGILFVGVADDETILGLEDDKFENEDKLLLFLTNTLKSQIGMLQMSNVNFHIEKIEKHDILRVDISPSSQPCYLSHDKEERFYIRTGPSTNVLKLSKVYPYIKKRFSV